MIAQLKSEVPGTGDENGTVAVGVTRQRSSMEE